jgi:hypothetical protein
MPRTIVWLIVLVSAESFSNLIRKVVAGTEFAATQGFYIQLVCGEQRFKTWVTTETYPTWNLDCTLYALGVAFAHSFKHRARRCQR